jgi:hypothetical protein
VKVVEFGLGSWGLGSGRGEKQPEDLVRGIVVDLYKKINQRGCVVIILGSANMIMLLG